MQQRKETKFKPKQQNKSKTQKQEKLQQKQDEKYKIHRGVFIAEQRRKGKGGRIKSQSIPNKIQVRMRRDCIYLHQSQVQWVEISRYNKKQGRRNKKEQKKSKYKTKDQQNGKKNSQPTKYQQKKQKKQQTQQNKSNVEQKNKNKQNKTDVQQNKVAQKITQQIKNNIEQAQATIEQKQEETNKKDLRDQQQQSSNSSQSDEDDKKDQENQQASKQELQKKNKQDEQQKKEDDIVIVAQIKKQIANPFWKKPFVGILKFNFRDSKKSQYKQKNNKQKSHVSRILDDHDIDFDPIHKRIPTCYVNKNNQCQKLFEKYVEQNLKANKQDKGGKIRNKILDQLQSTYALVKFVQNYKGNIYVDVIKIIGKARTIDGQCNCFLYEHQLNNFEHEQPKQQIESQCSLNTTPLHKKFDDMVFTIDPLTSTDLDDALSVKKISQNQYQFGIHIADVSSYINKIPRQELTKRTTSVYLPHYVFHMLPANIVTICSLNPNVQRLAFTVFVRMNQQGVVLNSRLEKNILKSRFKLAYEQAQSIITDEMKFQEFSKLHDCSQQQFKTLIKKLKTLQKIGLAHRKKRLIFQIFDNDQVKFQLDQQKWPISFTVTSRFTAQKIVQEFMIIGNIQSAKKLTQIDPKNSLIIHHPRPSDLAIRHFNEYFDNLQYKFKFQSSYKLQQDLLKVSQMQNISEEIKRLCYFKARRAQQTANYKLFSQVQNSSQIIHFALGLRYYTHFTSPMRRIADIVVHQILSSEIDNTLPKKQLTSYQIQQANWGRKNTKRLKKDLTQIYLCLMIFKTKKVVECQAITVSFGCKSISIFIPMLDMSKQIMWKDMQVDKVYKNKDDAQKVDVIIYYDKRDAKKDVIWVVEKFMKFPIKIDCSDEIPLSLNFQFVVQSNKGQRKIKPYIY